MTKRLAANSLSELGDLGFQIQRANDAITALKRERDALVLQLLNDGFSEREIARAGRLTGPRVHQIKAEAERLAKYHDEMARTRKVVKF